MFIRVENILTGEFATIMMMMLMNLINMTSHLAFFPSSTSIVDSVCASFLVQINSPRCRRFSSLTKKREEKKSCLIAVKLNFLGAARPRPKTRAVQRAKKGQVRCVLEKFEIYEMESEQ